MADAPEPSYRDRSRRVSEYIGAVVFNAIFLYVLNRLPDWHTPFISARWGEVLWAINLSLIVHIIGNFALIFHHPRLLHHQLNIAFAAVSAVASWTVYRVFPFDLSRIPLDWFPSFVRALLLFTLAAAVVSGLVHALKMLRLLFLPDDPES